MTDRNQPLTARQELARHWPIVLAAALGVGFGTMGIGFYSLGLFVKPLQAEFGWSRAAVSGAATFQQLGIFLSAPLVGRLADRIGLRPLAVASYVAMPLALVALSMAGPSVWGWYGLWLLVSLAGCGTTPAAWARMVSMRFDAARGLALGLMLVGTGLAAALVPALLGPVFAHDGWRTATLVMAGAAALVGIPLGLMQSREAPAPAAREKDGHFANREGGHFERNRPVFMLLAIAFLVGVIVAGLIIHLVPMLVDRGMDAGLAAKMAASIGLAVIAARVIVGWLFDRFHAPYVAAVFLAMPVGSCLLLGLGGPVLPAALMLGLAAGAEVDMLAFFTSRYAAMKNYGATYGVILGTFSLGAALGPMMVGASVDATGGYGAALAGSGLGLGLVVVLIACLGPYRAQE
ncbi:MULTISPECIES: MFS transporter [unclassified Novosphingobium]|uniref:MFS transporter n=1 Tax=unclassified Novosphingobium TaxID=2644732 RepID=UPI00086B7AFD|nr:MULTISPECIES: MFS transporter [unclassified Novosphingobium]MDR6707198.1 MFS family permease [Novosphingobium sp. 1748]ODU82844.1 MAG: MFS transporter [Novosphingobium sp. SCN 63-17]OJX96548.1 MAG: MFS transporter [Novosphingobium sp. 63-713]